jgi:phosphate transport system substrate-binding protein
MRRQPGIAVRHHLTIVLPVAAVALLTGADASAQGATRVSGAGASFPSPIYAKWMANYTRRDPALDLGYEAIGSERGVQRLLAGEVDFAGCDDPDIFQRLAGDRSGDYVLLPSVIGAVVPVVNVPGFTGTVAFSPESLASIYLGRITKWNDALLQRLNQGRLPNLDIVVVHRSDGSGTSAAWTRYLSKFSQEWQTRVGAGSSPGWPVGRSAEGNDGVVRLVSATAGAIGYAEFMHALQAHVSYGRIKNRSGAFVSASLESIAAAAEAAVAGDRLALSILDAPGRAAYPVASFTWLVVPARVIGSQKHAALTDFLRWMLTAGQKQAPALGFLPLPAHVVARAGEMVDRIRPEQ